MTSRRAISYVVLPHFLLFLAAGCDVGDVDPLDLSDFEEFEFAQSPALGFCPDVNAPYRATIRHETDGAYVFEVSVFVDGDPLTDDCLEVVDSYIDDRVCVLIVELLARELTSAEVQRVRDVFSDVGIRWWTSSWTGLVCIDPCLIRCKRSLSFGHSSEIRFRPIILI